MSEPVFNEKNEQSLFSCALPAVITLIHLSRRRCLKKPCNCEMCRFVSLKARRKSLISLLYLESFLGGLVWEGGGGKVGREKTKEI